ncbi:hypothetical protein ACFSTD_02305 [Novosphingobium colocasiae]
MPRTIRKKKQIVDRLFSFVLNDERVRFIGNVEIGKKTISLEEISACYDAVIVAPGASGNGRLGILGEDLPGSWQANDFVGFYNGHPDQSDLPFDLTGDRAVIVGNGNVALDLARILMTPPAELRKTDIADHAIDALMQSNIREVVLLGRRGPMDGAFHNPELEELAHLTDVDIEVTGAIVPDETDAELAGAEWHVRRKMKTLRNLAGRPRREAGRKNRFPLFGAHPWPLKAMGVSSVCCWRTPSRQFRPMKPFTDPCMNRLWTLASFCVRLATGEQACPASHMMRDCLS